MVTLEGLPVGYEVFPGNMYEGDTFKHAIEKIKERYKVKQAVIVADSGLLSRPNIELLEKEKLEFILDAHLKSLSDKWQDRKVGTASIMGCSSQGINVKPEEMNVEDILISQYHSLWQVEESFCITKYDLKVRPVFHWSAKRICSHIAICFVAFSLIRFLQHRLKKVASESFSAERIREELFRIQENLLRNTVDKNRYVLPSKPGQDVLNIYDAMKKKKLWCYLG